MGRVLSKMKGERLTPALGEGSLRAVYVETNDTPGLAITVSPVRGGGRLIEVVPG